MNDSPKVEEPVIHLALPKGHMQEGVFSLLEEAGMKVCNRYLNHSEVQWKKHRNFFRFLDTFFISCINPIIMRIYAHFLFFFRYYYRSI